MNKQTLDLDKDSRRGRVVSAVFAPDPADMQHRQSQASSEEPLCIPLGASKPKLLGARAATTPPPAIWSAEALRDLGLSLEPSEVLYTFVHLDAEPSARDKAILDDEERARSQRFRQPTDCRRFIAAHASMRVLVAHCLDIGPEEVSFHRGHHGKPHLGTGLGSLQLSLSHSGAVALLAVTLVGPLGVDVEHVRELNEALMIAEQQFSPTEAATLHSLPPGERSAAFLRYWTHKESVIKATGEGLSRPLDSFELDLTGPMGAVLSFDGLPGAGSRWCLQELLAPSGFVAAGAVVSVPGATAPHWRAL